MVLALIAMLGVTATSLAGPWLIRSLVSTIEESIVHGTAGASQVVNISLVLLLVYALRPALRALQVWATHVAGWGSVAAARKEIYEHLQKLSPRYYTTTRTGQIMSRAINDTHHFETLIAHVIPETIVSFLTVAGVFVVLFSINPRLALYTLVPIPTYLLASFMMVVLLSVFAAVTGFIVSRVTGIELYTSLLGSAPGGMPEIVALSQAYEVDHSGVVVMQTVRRILIVMIYPLLVVAVSRLTKIS
jgi:ABC-type multidrug transport system fused ATPase/permease subunit